MAIGAGIGDGAASAPRQTQPMVPRFGPAAPIPAAERRPCWNPRRAPARQQAQAAAPSPDSARTVASVRHRWRSRHCLSRWRPIGRRIEGLVRIGATRRRDNRRSRRRHCLARRGWWHRRWCWRRGCGHRCLGRRCPTGRRIEGLVRIGAARRHGGLRRWRGHGRRCFRNRRGSLGGLRRRRRGRCSASGRHARRRVACPRIGRGDGWRDAAGRRPT